MSIIKLNAIDSTNDYLKQLTKDKWLENYTIVMAHEQTKGKGQLGSKWLSEPGKNLTMSVLIKDLPLTMISVFDLNVAVAVAAITTLSLNNIPNPKIKWPNDIMADGKKVGGILIENTVKPNGNFDAIVGIGLNMNQTNFEGLPQANSLTCLTGKVYDIETIAIQIRDNIQILLNSSIETIWEFYLNALFKVNTPVVFEDTNQNRFMGMIQTVNRDGKLVVLREDDLVHLFEVKEIKMLF